MKKIYILLFLTFSLSGFKSPNAFEPNYKFHSVYIYNFTKYIQWPAQGGDFKIYILGQQPEAADAFRLMAESKTAGTRQITVKSFANLNELNEADIVFIPRSFSSFTPETAKKFTGKNTLLITEKEGMIEKGSSINFVIIDDKLKFEISKANLEKAGLKVSTQLMQMAIVK